jgi:hypothetical protein
MSGDREGEDPWHEVLHAMLESPGASDSNVIEFIEDEVPNEGDILDYKTDLYASANDPHNNKERQANLVKHFSALSNVRNPARFRYLFIGFEDASKEFVGMQHRDSKGGNQVLEIDDADLRNIFTHKISPTPNFEIFSLTHDGNSGGVIAIRQAEQVPLVVETTLRKSSGGEFIAAGQAYTRDGSRTIRMTSDDFVSMMRYREELITGKIQDLTQGLSRVVGIPDDQLANLDLSVSPSGEGIPVSELITTAAPTTLENNLTTAVKAAKGAGGYRYDRHGLYRFFARRDKLDLDGDDRDDKLEFLFRANLHNHLHGAYWLSLYEGDVDSIIEKVLSEDLNGVVLPPFERVLLVLGKQDYLRQIDGNSGWDWHSSRAKKYSKICNEALHKRVTEYTGETVRFDSTTYQVYKMVYGNASKEPEVLMDEIMEELLDVDKSTSRSALRQVELILLAESL